MNLQELRQQILSEGFDDVDIRAVNELMEDEYFEEIPCSEEDYNFDY